VRITVKVLDLQTHQLYKLTYSTFQFSTTGNFIHHERFRKNFPDGHSRIQRCKRILKDHLDVRAQGPHMGRLNVSQINSGLSIWRLKPDVPTSWSVSAHNHATYSGFAATGLSHQPQSFTAVHAKGDAVHGLHMTHHLLENPFVDGEVLFEVLHFEKKLRFSHEQPSYCDAHPRA
jgi:hypothetical protein